MKILLTGFEPFNGDKINPSQLIVDKVEAPLGISLIKEILPVEFKQTSIRIRELLEEHKPDVVISIGQAGNRVGISVERVAINLNNVRSSNGKKELIAKRFAQDKNSVNKIATSTLNFNIKMNIWSIKINLGFAIGAPLLDMITSVIIGACDQI